MLPVVSIAPLSTLALAVFRVALGAVVLLDLAESIPDHCDFYSDDGLFSMASRPDGAPWMGVHELGGSCAATRGLMLLHATAAACLLVGFCTPLAASTCYVMALSHIRRSPFTFSGGDVLLCLLSAWAALLPTAQRWSLDARRRPAGAPRASTVRGVAALGLQLQVCVIYLTSAVYKTLGAEEQASKPDAPSQWLAGDAVRAALACCEYLTFVGDGLRRLPTVCAALTYATVLIEYAAPFLLLLPVAWLRFFTVASLIAMHVVMGAAMNLGNFAVASIVALLALLPLEPDRVLWGYEAEPAEASAAGAVDASTPPRPWSLRTAVAALFIATNLGTAVLGFFPGAVERLENGDWLPPRVQAWAPRTCAAVASSAAELLNGAPRWNMFARPPASCGWWVLPAVLHNGSVVDAHKLRHYPRVEPIISWQRPRWPAFQHNSVLWHSYYERLNGPHPDDQATTTLLLESLARYHCVRQPEIERIYVMFNLEDHDFDRWRVRYSTEFLWEKNCTGGQGRAPTGAPPLPLPRPRWEGIP